MGEMIKAPFELVKSIFTGNRGDDPTSGVRKQERAEARRLETEKAARLAALDRQRTGRSSLISTSELGVQDKLGA